MPDDERIGRRHFFRHGLRHLLRPLSQAIAPVEHVAAKLGEMAGPRRDENPAEPPALRPPGALPELKFLETCSRCGECVKVCPAQCIKIDPARAGGAPMIEVDTMPCVVCDGLQCMPVCPTGALVPTPLSSIRMGTAVWKEPLCLRSTGEDCRICTEHCPIGSFAIELQGNEVVVHPNGCIGCGVCQHDCPTSPKSIVVIPRAMRDLAMQNPSA